MKTIIKLMLIFVCTSCADNFLDIKRDKSQLVPETLDDFEGLLNNTAMMNVGPYSLSMLSTDEMYTSGANWLIIKNPQQKNAYIWAKDIFEGTESTDWNNGYRTILYSNIILDRIDKSNKIDMTSNKYKEVKGTSLFFRAKSYWALAQQFAAPVGFPNEHSYGLPIRDDADPKLKSVRYNVSETYSYIENDLLKAIDLLPEHRTTNFLPNKLAAYVLLARLYLQNFQYEKARLICEEALLLNHNILNYNQIVPRTAYSFAVRSADYKEVLYYETAVASELFPKTKLRVPMSLYDLYDLNDLRKSYFFEKTGNEYTFKGSYSGAATLFTGISIAELYLIYAETLVREDNLTKASSMLNVLIQNRYRTGFEPNYNFTDKQVALSIIINERRKELILRGVRWSDLRRLNQEPGLQINLNRIIDGKSYSLPSNDIRYIFPIPDKVIIDNNMIQIER